MPKFVDALKYNGENNPNLYFYEVPEDPNVEKCLNCGHPLRNIDGIYKCKKCKQLHRYVIKYDDKGYGFMELIKIPGEIIGCGMMRIR